MIVIYGTHVQNDNISVPFFQFFKILIFRVLRGEVGQKIVQNDKQFSPSHFISQEPCIV